MKSLLIVLVLSLAASMAHATTFEFSYSGPGVAGSGTLLANLVAPDEYAVVGGIDNATGGGVNGRLTLFANQSSPTEILSPSGYFLYDDLLLPEGNPIVTNGGLLFTNETGGEVNLYSVGPSAYIYYDNTGYNAPINFDPSAVPEPATFALLVTGMAGLLCTRRTRRARSQLA